MPLSIDVLQFLKDEPSGGPERRVVKLRADIASKDELLEEIARQAAFPSYFGMNWDALNDCLMDLSWLLERELFIWHAGIPKLPKKDLAIYLTILCDAIVAWRKRGEHVLNAGFPESCRPRLVHLDGWDATL